MRFPAAFGLVAALGGCVDPAQEEAREKLICTSSSDRLTQEGRVAVILGEYHCGEEEVDFLVCSAAKDFHAALQAQQNDLSIPETTLAYALESRCRSVHNWIAGR